jgi:sulfur-carrier protein adenylyltransferase/sulfurtransferase
VRVSLTAAERARYQRHLSLQQVGAAGQEKLKAARVLVVGAGGLGSPAALYLAAAGCGTLGLADYDVVELSNLQRQVLFDTADLGRPKASAGAVRLAALNPEIRVVAHALELTPANAAALIAQYDLVLDGSDRLATRYLVNDACVLLRRPLVSAAIHQFEGQLLTYIPGKSACYRCAFPRGREALVGDCATAGVLGVLPGVLGTLQATEALKLITGIGTSLAGRLLTYDALEMRFAEFRIARHRDCAVCGDTPSITALQEDQPMAHSATPGDVRHISPAELHNQLKRPGAKPPLLIDVREDYEFEAGHLDGARHIPLSQLPQHLGELGPDSDPVFICRSGMRSLSACALALRANVRAPTNLEGGMMRWAAEIDPSIQVA